MKNRLDITLVLFGAACVSGCASLSQTPDEAMYRKPGDRLLTEVADVGVPARLHWQYAWLSVASYNAIIDEPGDKPTLGSLDRAGPTTIRTPTGDVTCMSPEDELKAADWKRFEPRWPSPQADANLYETLRNSHTRVQVWENSKLKTVVVSFGGTDGRNILDWLSNLRWFLPEREDEYAIVSKRVSAAFFEEFKRRAKSPEGAYLREFTLHATGHSLGGGLAQQFAYSLPVDPEHVVPRVTHVYAFDASPVTGHSGVDEQTRTANARDMEIDRIYERGEFLAAARASTSWVLVPSKINPRVSTTRYMLFWKSPFEFVSSHSMPQLACHLQNSKNRPPPVATPVGPSDPKAE